MQVELESLTKVQLGYQLKGEYVLTPEAQHTLIMLVLNNICGRKGKPRIPVIYTEHNGYCSPS